MTRARVLFVDDEPRILEGLRRCLRGQRRVWEMSFAASGVEALELLAQAPYDVVLSDMRMPQMDGGELLSQVRLRHPQAARVVLSGQTEPASAIKVAVSAHRFLTKPTDPEGIIAVIEQLAVPTSVTHAVETRRIAGVVGALPTLSEHLDPLTEFLTAPHLDNARVARAARNDVGLTAKLLQLSNSAFFGARAPVAAVDSMVNTLGLSTIQALVASGQVLWTCPDWDPEVHRYLRASWRHCAATAWLVGSMASPANRAYAQAAALLQDVGRFGGLAHAATVGDTSIDLAGTTWRGVPYRDIAVELLHLWGLPAPIVAAVAQRDVEHRAEQTGLGVTGAVRAAHIMLQQTPCRDPADGTHDDELARLLTHPQLSGHAGDWRRVAEEACARTSEWPGTGRLTTHASAP